MKKLSLFALIALFFTVGISSAHAANLNGWAWSENFGWISFNSVDSGAGGGPYAVSINSSGNWSGYAWSQYLGWVSFNVADTSVCSGSSQAHLNTSTGAVTGFARALVYGGTDGCLELSGTNHTSPTAGGAGGVTFDSTTGRFSGYAWDGDVAAHTGAGWIQFNPGADNTVVCLSSDCGYGGSITGTCAATTAYQNVAPNSSVTFQATPTSGNSTYTYEWNPPSSFGASNQFSASYSSSAPGPLVVIKDTSGLMTGNISCPSVSVLGTLGASNIQVGKTVATANSGSIALKQINPFAIVWSLSLQDTYSCTPSVSPDPNNSIWNTNWKSISLNQVDNGDGTKTWAGNTGTNMKAGSLAAPVTPGIYQFKISCTADMQPTQTSSATVKVNSSSQSEI